MRNYFMTFRFEGELQNLQYHEKVNWYPKTVTTYNVNRGCLLDNYVKYNTRIYVYSRIIPVYPRHAEWRYEDL